MNWLFIATIAYFLLAGTSLIDKYLVAKEAMRPTVLAFAIGVLGLLVFLLVPVVGFTMPPVENTVLAIFAGAFFIFGIFWNFEGLRLYEASRIVPAIGGLVPVFSFLFIFVASQGQETLSGKELGAFLLLVVGTILIMREPGTRFTFNSIRIAGIAALFFALFFVLAKYAYQGQGFWEPFMLMRLGGFAAALVFILSKEVRSFFVQKSMNTKKRAAFLFIVSISITALANILQNVAVFLAPVAAIPLINALQGVQYVFLLLFVMLLSILFPRILKEKTSQKVLSVKIFSIVCIIIGLAMLTL